MHDFSTQFNLTGVAVAQSDTVNLVAPNHLKSIIFFASGTVSIVDSNGTTFALTLPAAADGGVYPWQLTMNIRRVNDTGTSLTDAQMLGLR